MEKPGFSLTELFQLLGAPGAMMAVVCWCWFKGYIITAREQQQREKMLNQAIADRDKQLADQKLETILWRDHAIDNMRILQQVNETARMAVKKLPKSERAEHEGEGSVP